MEWPAGNFSLEGEFLTLEWIHSLFPTFWRVDTGWTSQTMLHVLRKCEKDACGNRHPSLASSPGRSQILSHSPIFLHGCEIKSGSGLGMQLTPPPSLHLNMHKHIHTHTLNLHHCYAHYWSSQRENIHWCHLRLNPLSTTHIASLCKGKILSFVKSGNVVMW